MKTFKDYTGTEGIDKVIECAPYVNEILNDSNLIKSFRDKTLLEVGATVVKQHGEAFEKLRTALGNNEESDSLGMSFAASQLMKEILSNQDILDFFTSFSTTKS